MKRVNCIVDGVKEERERGPGAKGKGESSDEPEAGNCWVMPSDAPCDAPQYLMPGDTPSS
ncbi:hypothetical protein BDK51DRAFT_38335 [Blyttiomyces helicus]|uniref:Uncharacterized protein n=1 Tax=Blyttiomyces helicus TaxID=388810 RepID=A0A4P9WDH4_9FUNG|nr:hypothetical protein BDK51DRAFT_38335 [Blyttiomyces helicus]|eukprot:RKO90741.1 hypothetical protein BDK51DRAFT_38335 [Blyttiomyces helicus]